jgi:drug/metabolite transporter (DMT)-like permease
MSPALRGGRPKRCRAGVATPEEQPFATQDWACMGAVALMWGSSFLFIDIGVDHLAPTVVAGGRLACGAATLALVPAARRSVPAGAWPSLAALAVCWMAVPFVLFAVAQRHIDSSLAGMLNAAAPLCTALVAAAWARSLPERRRVAGLVIGFAGVVAVCLPTLGASESSGLGIGLVLLATLLYGVAFNLTARLQPRYGALPVIWRAQVIAAALLAVPAALALPDSEFAWSSVAAVAVLGSLGTAGAFAAFSTLAGRVGSTRASVTTYLLPAVAIVLGAVVRDERIAAASVGGCALILAGAYMTTRVRSGTA